MPAASPFAFSRATGLVFQTVGLALAIGSCCLFSCLGLVQDQVDQPIGSFTDWLRIATVPQIVGAVDILSSVVVGTLLLAVGIGLQSDRRSAARAGVWVTGTFAVIWWASAITFLIAWARWWTILVGVGSALGSTLLFLLAGNSARLHRVHPPPTDDSGSDDFGLPTDEQKVDQVLDALDRADDAKRNAP